MTLRRPFAALTIALAITACSKSDDKTALPQPSGPVATVPPPAGKQWSDVVSATPEGGMRIGNPDAPVKLVEYGSFTCPHCRAFEQEAADELQQKFIASGKLSWEFRSTVIHGGPDVSITLLMNCRGPETYFPLMKQLYATQDTWFGEATITKLNAQQSQITNLAPSEQFKAYIEAMGLYPFFGSRGLPRAQANACLFDQKAIDAMTANQQRYSTKDGITGTPAFVINGTTWTYESNGVTIWKQLEPTLARMTQ